jgi:hypothetical protein
MRTRIPPTLKWLLSTHARARANIRKLEAKKLALQGDVGEIDAHIAALKLQMADLERVGTLFDAPFALDVAPDLNTCNRIIPLKRGRMTTLIKRYLARRYPEWSSTTELVVHVWNHCDATADYTPRIRLLIRYRLKDLAQAGVIERLHSTTGNHEGHWRMQMSRGSN